MQVPPVAPSTVALTVLYLPSLYVSFQMDLKSTFDGVGKHTDTAANPPLNVKDVLFTAVAPRTSTLGHINLCA